mgnify:CR=1 FL=1
MENSLGENLATYLQKEGITELRLAVMLGIDEKKVKQWISCAKEPSSGEISMIASVLQISVEELLNGKNTETIGNRNAVQFEESLPDKPAGENVSPQTMNEKEYSAASDTAVQSLPASEIVKKEPDAKRAEATSSRKYTYYEVPHDTVWAKIFWASIIICPIALIVGIFFISPFFLVVAILAEFIRFYALIAAKQCKENTVAKVIFVADIVFLVALNILGFFAEHFGFWFEIVSSVLQILCLGSFLFIFNTREGRQKYEKWLIILFAVYILLILLYLFVSDSLFLLLLVQITPSVLIILLGIAKENRYLIERVGYYKDK